MSKHSFYPPELMRAMFLGNRAGAPMGISPEALMSALRRKPKATTATLKRNAPAPHRQSMPTPKESPTSDELRRRWRTLMAAPTAAPWS